MNYQIPCDCGEFLPVNESMAGSSLRCECGRLVWIPSLMQLRATALPDVRITADDLEVARRKLGTKIGIIAACCNILALALLAIYFVNFAAGCGVFLAYAGLLCATIAMYRDGIYPGFFPTALGGGEVRTFIVDNPFFVVVNLICMFAGAGLVLGSCAVHLRG